MRASESSSKSTKIPVEPKHSNIRSHQPPWFTCNDWTSSKSKSMFTRSFLFSCIELFELVTPEQLSFNREPGWLAVGEDASDEASDAGLFDNIIGFKLSIRSETESNDWEEDFCRLSKDFLSLSLFASKLDKLRRLFDFLSDSIFLFLEKIFFFKKLWSSFSFLMMTARSPLIFN